MFCEKCGASLHEGAKFCGSCGAKTEAAAGSLSQTAAESEKAAAVVTVGGSGNIWLCPDGKYRWYYEFPMMRNPVILFTVWKVMLISTLAPALLTFLIRLEDGLPTALKDFGTTFGIVAGILFALSLVGYFIVALSYGFRYIVLFEMDDQTVVHIQQGRQFKKAEALGWLTFFTGAAAGNAGFMGTGMLAASKQQMTSEFRNVESIIGLRRKNTIKVNQLFAKNQVYVKAEDYDFVWNYITSHCPKAKIK